MKRPDGFGGRQQAEGRQQAASPGRGNADRVKPRSTKPAARAATSRPSARPVARGEAPRKQPAAGKELRSASRERRRYEKVEIRRFTRRARHRRLGWLVAIGIAGVLAGLLTVAVYSPLLALRTIRVEGTAAVSAAEVSDAIAGQLGTPLALIDYDRIRAELDAYPLIRSFVTEAQPPSTLVVRITERRPVGSIPTPAGFSIVDPAGVVLSTTTERAPGGPLIDVGAEGVDSAAFQSVVEVLLALPDVVRTRVDTARATSKDDVTLVLSGVGQRVVWGSADRSALKSRVLADLIATQGENAKVEFDVSAPLSPVVRPL